jgi:dihydroorotase
MAELTDAGCVAFSHADAPLSDTQLLLRALQYAATFDFPVWLRPQDPGLARGGVAHDGQVATRLGLAAIPVCAETIALSTILLLARETGARIHLCRMSSAEGVDMVRQAKARGLKVSCDIAIHHAHLSEMDIGYFDPNCHLTPPLRSQRDRDGLRAALSDGTVDALCSDHTPVDEDAKQLPFGEAESGATGVELLLPLTLKWIEETRLPLVQGLARITSEPARILGVSAGAVKPGASADLCVFDPARYWKIEPAALKSQGKNTPYTGIEVKGKVGYTLVDGQVVYEAG